MIKQPHSLILAGGYSSRMGTDKALLMIDGSPVLEIIIKKLMPVSCGVTVVCGVNYQNVRSLNLPEEIQIVENEHPEDGMLSSIKTGICSIKHCEHILIHLIDQPFIKEETYKTLVNAIDDQYDVIKPGNSAQKRSGHPIIISGSVAKQIKISSQKNTLRDVLQQVPSQKVKRIEVNDQHIFDNINTPSKLEEIKKGK